MGLEIERKFLLDRLPSLPAGAVARRMEQGYLAADGDGEPGRLRRTVQPDGSVKLTHTVKTGAGLVRHETERSITPAEFEALWPRTEGRRLRKTRHRVADGDLEWEIDEFDDVDLVLAEVEIPTADTPVTIPAWLAPHMVREVTDEREYRNYEIALRSDEGRNGTRRRE